MQSALALIPQGNWQAAAAALEQAAGLHANAGRAYDEARCLQLAATLRRSAGDLEQARLLNQRAAAVAPGDAPLAVSILAEQAETAFAEGRYPAAVSAWATALDQGRQAGLKADGLSAMLRRRAAAFLALDQVASANSDFDQAYQLLEAAHGGETAAFVRVEQANGLWQYGHLDAAEQAIAATESGLDGESTGPHLLAELLVLRSRLARGAGRMDTAAEYARRAREAALQAVAPLSYFAAGVELAEALQAQGDYTGAYGTLATTWATLSDVLGREVARSWVEPCLAAYNVVWGDLAFQQARSEYEAQRRAATERRG
jgi:tetratricopeptide (TPR) repeat protein